MYILLNMNYFHTYYELCRGIHLTMGQTSIIKNADLNISEWTTRLKRSVKTIHPSIFNNLEMKNVLYRLHDQFV